MTTNKPCRDTISLRNDFLPHTRAGLEVFANRNSCEGLIEGGSPETWAWFWFLIRAADDNEDWFPAGKWATVQRLEGLLDECAGR